MDAWDGDTVVLACEGGQPDRSAAIEAVVYELARHNGESPMDRGAALRRRIERLAPGYGGHPADAPLRALAAAADRDLAALAVAFDRLAAERGWRGEESGAESASRVVSMTGIRVPA